MRITRIMAVLLIGLLSILAACAKTAPTTPATTPTTPAKTALIAMPAFLEMGPPESLNPWPGVFSPYVLTVSVGTTVTWVNRDKEHSVVSDDGLFKQYLRFGESFNYTFTKPGIFNYHCELWDMHGRVIVE